MLINPSIYKEKMFSYMDASLQIIRVSIIAVLCVVLPVFLSSCATPSSSCYLRSDEISDIRNGAESGNAESQYTLGSWYHHGDCLKQDFAKAMDWYQQSASQGNIDAQSSLGFLYDHHKNDMGKAIEWYEKAALQDDIRSMRILGVLYVNGTKVEKNIDEGKKWFILAAQQDDLFSIGYLIRYSTGDEAAKWKAKEKRITTKEGRALAAIENRKRALELFGNIGISWLPIDPSFLKEKSTYKSPSESSDAEARGYLYGPMAAVSWPAWLLTVVVGEAGVAASKSAEHTYLKSTVEKVFDESNIQEFFIEKLLEAANEQLDNPVTALGKHKETKNYFDENTVNTILELNNGLVKIIADTNHRYTVSIELEYKIIDTETQYVMNQKTIKASGKRITLASSSGSDEKEGIDTKLARESLEEAYQKLANNIVESVLELP